MTDRLTMQGRQAVSISEATRGSEAAEPVVSSASGRNEEWVLRYIHSLEQAERVGDIALGGLHVWPWVRIRVFQELLGLAPGVQPYRFERSLRQKARAAVEKLSGQAAAALTRLRDESETLRDVDILFYSYEPVYQVDHAGADYDRILDPVSALVGAGRTWHKFHVGGGQPARDRMQAVPGVALPSDAMKHLPLTPGPQAEVKDVSRWLAALESRIHEDTGVRADLVNHALWTVAMVRRYRAFFRTALEGARASAVLLPCYYGERQSGLIWACRDLGIRTVDVQHGKQGILSLGYGNWPAVPDGGYETMPDMFWVWGRGSAENLQVGAPGQPGMPEIQVTGNMYVAQWVHGTPFDYRGVAPAYWSRLDAAERVILVTLQPFPLDKAIPPALVGAMRNSPQGWLWLLRRHPAGRPSRDEIVALLEANDIPAHRYDIDGASRQPLYALMKHADVHVTLWSSCGYEALCFGVPTIFLDDFANTLYSCYLKRGLFYWASSAAEILERAQAVADNWDPREEDPYIETDQDLTIRALADLHSGRHRLSSVGS